MMTTNPVPSSSGSGILCDVCQKSNIDDNDVPTATHYCTDCNENQCSKCSRFHGKLNATKDHKLVDIDDNSVRKSDSLELFEEDCHQNKMKQTERQEYLEDPAHVDLSADVQERTEKESDCGIESKKFEQRLEESIKEIKDLAQGLQKSRKESAEMKEQYRILMENFDRALDREQILKNELDAIKNRSQSGIFGNVREALDTSSKISNPQQNHTASSSDMNISVDENFTRKFTRLSSCCICSMTLQDNRMTPCFHIACLKCLEDIQSNTIKQPGNVLPCPSCGKTFAIPSEGMTGLPKNIFFTSPIEIEKTFHLKHESKICEIHSKKALDYYCKDCETVACDSCFDENHKFHDCEDATTIDKDFRRRLEETTKKLSMQKQEILSRRMDTVRLKKEFLAKTFETSKDIVKISETKQSFIKQHAQILLRELSTIEQKHRTNMDKEIDDIERNIKLLGNFVTFCTKMKVKGSTNALRSCGYALITTAEELSKENEEYLLSPSKLFEIKFTATSQDENIQVGANVIGKLSESTKLLESKVFVFGIDDFDSITKDIIEINLNRSENVSKAQRMPFEMTHGSAAAVYCDSIFVTGIGKKCDEIWRFDATSSKWKKCASLVQGRECHSVAFVDHILYICGGWVESTRKVLDDVEAYDTLTDNCVAVGKLTFAVRISGNCVPFKSSLYIFGGNNANGETVNNVQVYDTKSNTCILLSKPLPRANILLQAALWESTVILLGYNDCITYNFETQVWKVRDQFKTDVIYFGLTISNGLVFVFGGGDTIKDADGNLKWTFRDDVRWLPIVNILNNIPIKWKHHAKLPKPSLVYAFGKMDFG